MASLKVALDMRKKAKDGKGSILIRICHRGTVAEVPTKIRMDKDHFKDGKIVNTPNASVLNLSIQEKVLAIDKTIAVLMMDEEKFLNMSANEIKQIFLGQKPIIKKKEDVTVVAMFKDYMENSTLKEGTKDIMRIACNKVVTFAGNNVKMNQLDLKWLRSFDKFLSETQCANGRAIYLRSLRAVCNYAKHLGVTTNYPFDNFQIKQEPTRKRSIPIDLFRKFYHYPTTKVNQQYRDYFFLMFFLIGINTKDLLLAKKSQIVDGRLEYVRAKTNKRYSILIEPEAQELLDKYKGNGEYLVNAMDHCKHYKSFAREINDALCNIGEVVYTEIPNEDNLFASSTTIKTIQPIIPDITTYYARHTWATLAHEIGIPVDVISMALGHSFGNRTTLIYIKPDRSKVDEANRKVIDYLLDR